MRPHSRRMIGVKRHKIGGLGDDSQEVPSHFGGAFPGWEQICRLIDTVPLMTGSDQLVP